MSLFRWKERWRYRRAAKSRHGIHSPFVYRFVEEALRPKLPADLRQAFREAAKTRYLFGQFATLYRCAKFLSDEKIAKDQPAFEILHGTPETLDSEAAEKLALLGGGCCLIVPDIHESPERAACWERLRGDGRVNLSMDLWYLGLLMYKEDFKAKQHFVLRHPD
jgi:hypothetical protein